MGSFSGFECICLCFLGWGPESNSFGPGFLRWDLFYLKMMLKGWCSCIAMDLWMVIYPVWWRGGAEPFLETPLSIGKGSWLMWLNLREMNSTSNVSSPCWFCFTLLVVMVWVAIITLLYMGQLSFISILQVQTQGRRHKWASQVPTGSLWQAESMSFLNSSVMPWPRKYFSTSIKAFPFTSCVVSALWWMSNECQGAPSTQHSIPAQELFSFNCNSRNYRAPWKPVGVLPLASAKPGFYLCCTALPHSLYNVWTNQGTHLVLMLAVKKWKMNFCQTRTNFQLYLIGSVSHPKKSGPLSNKVYDNRFSFY